MGVKTWRLWERGRALPYDSNIRKLAETFEVEPDFFGQIRPAPLGMSDLSTPAASDMITAMFESIEQRVLTQLAQHAREVESQLSDQADTLKEMKQTLNDIREGIAQEQAARKAAEDARREAEAATKELRGILDVLAALPAFASDLPPKPAARAKRAK